MTVEYVPLIDIPDAPQLARSTVRILRRTRQISGVKDMITGNIVVIDGTIAILTGYMMDPSYIVVDYLYPNPCPNVVIYRYAPEVTVTPITLADLGTSHISSFPILYPEYFI